MALKILVRTLIVSPLTMILQMMVSSIYTLEGDQDAADKNVD
jgi:hypothetical protein